MGCCRCGLAQTILVVHRHCAGAYHLTIDKDVGRVVAGTEVFRDGHVDGDMLLLARVFNGAGGRIVDVFVFVVESSAASHHVVCRFEQADVDRAVAGLGRDVAGDGEVDGKFGHVFAAFGGFAVAFECADADAGGVEL